MKLTDTRRLTGPNLLLDGPGAILDAETDQPDALSTAWRARLTEALHALGWGETETAVRAYAGGISLAFEAPLDALYTATEVNEWAFARAVGDLGGDGTAALGDVGEDHTLDSLRASAEAERNPGLLALEAEASQHGVAFLWDDDEVSVGLGTGSQTVAVDALPESPDWSAIHDISVALVTGTNGKSTTSRMLGAIVRAAGRIPGMTSTDGIVIGDEMVESGDYSGPGGARTALRDKRVEVGVLEVARGGILRRGLGLPRATAAAVTNLGEDHLGEYGIHTVAQLAEAKFVVAKSLGRGGALVTNHDDPHCHRNGLLLEPGLRERGAHLVWTGLRPDSLPDGPAVSVVDGEIVRREATDWVRLVPVVDLPAAMGGAARYNVRNALTAAGLAHALGLPDAAIRDGLTAFTSDTKTNPGRGNVFDLHGATVWVDFAHNAHGLAAVTQTVAALPAERRLVMISHAGDRTDREIRGVAEAVSGLDAERYLVADLPDYRRGREPGEVQALLRETLLARGIPADRIAEADDPEAGTRLALDWARPGDFLLLLVLSRREAALEAIREAGGVPQVAL
ncbi:MAG: Mur ligase family protein [Bacteroidota bacterium]